MTDAPVPLIDLADEASPTDDVQHATEAMVGSDVLYEVYFGLGHLLQLFDRPNTFRMSDAGKSLGCYLVRAIGHSELQGRALDLGTGSGAIALLLRGLGFSSIVATDISAEAVDTARDNELANFRDQRIEFSQGDLFEPLGPAGDDDFDLVIFNPPGWRTPSEQLLSELGEQAGELDLEAMFYGDRVLKRFLSELPGRLREGGRAIVGMNSLVGIADIIEETRTLSDGAGQLHFRLLERVELPLLLYTRGWRDSSDALKREFARVREQHRAVFLDDGESLRWFYEIVEVSVVRSPEATGTL